MGRLYKKRTAAPSPPPPLRTAKEEEIYLKAKRRADLAAEFDSSHARNIMEEALKEIEAISEGDYK